MKDLIFFCLCACNYKWGFCCQFSFFFKFFFKVMFINVLKIILEDISSNDIITIYGYSVIDARMKWYLQHFNCQYVVTSNTKYEEIWIYIRFWIHNFHVIKLMNSTTRHCTKFFQLCTISGKCLIILQLEM